MSSTIELQRRVSRSTLCRVFKCAGPNVSWLRMSFVRQPTDTTGKVRVCRRDDFNSKLANGKFKISVQCKFNLLESMRRQFGKRQCTSGCPQPRQSDGNWTRNGTYNFLVSFVYWTVHHLISWINWTSLMSLYESFLLLNMFRMLLHSSSGAGDCMWVYCLLCNDRCLCISVLFVGECLFVGLLVRSVLL